METLLIISALLGVGLVGEATAQTSTYIWDVNRTAVGTGGTGNWSGTASQNYWSQDGSTGHVIWSGTEQGNSVAQFEGTAGTVSLTGPFSTYSLVFTVGGYTLQSSSSVNRTITLTSGIVQTDTGTTSFAAGNGGSVTIAGSAGFTKQGNGTLILGPVANSYTGVTTVSAGTLKLGVSDGLRTNSAMTISSGATLDLNGFSQKMSGGALVSDGSITDSTGIGGTFSFESTTDSTISGTLSGSMNLTKNGGSSSVLTLSGSSANTFVGTTTVNFGTIALNKSSGVNALGGNVVIGDGSSVDTLRLDGSNQISDSSAVTVSSSGVFRLSGHSETIGSLAGVAGASVVMENGTLTSGGDSSTVYAGSISGSGGVLVKSGSGTLELSGTNTYTGTTTVSDGTLLINGSTSVSSAVTVGISGTLGGSGTVGGATIINGTHSVGNAGTNGGVGTQTITGNLSYASGSIFNWDLNDNSTATGFDKVAASGTVAVSTSETVFNVILGTTALAGIQDTGNTFWNTPYGTQSWTMESIFGHLLQSGSSFSSVQTSQDVSSFGSFSINGTDLTWTAVPEPTSALAGLLIGAGLLRRRRRAA